MPSSLPSSIVSQITEAATQDGVPVALALSIASPSNGDPTYVNPSTGGIGIMQLNPNIVRFLGVSNPQDSTQNINAGVSYLASLLRQYSSPDALAAYISGTGSVTQQRAATPKPNPIVQNFLDSSLNSATAWTSAALNSFLTADLKPQTYTYLPWSLTPSPVPTSQPADPLNFAPPSLPPSPADQDLIDSTGLDNQPWYEVLGHGATTGNPKLRVFQAPVSFNIILPYGYSPLQGSNGPISVQLNASIRTLDVESSHVINKEATRTGMSVTMWGQRPEIISGAGSTGAFMNMNGLTAMMSLKPGRPKITTDFMSTNTTVTANGQRVLAQDAFVELLTLFKMNGVWYFTENTSATFSTNHNIIFTGNLSQSLLGQAEGKPVSTGVPDSWQPQSGGSMEQNRQRVNDVLARGYVAMNFRDRVYLGYFKSLTWTMDADKPFSWDFQFSFQSESVLTNVYYPSSKAVSVQAAPLKANQ